MLTYIKTNIWYMHPPINSNLQFGGGISIYLIFFLFLFQASSIKAVWLTCYNQMPSAEPNLFLQECSMLQPDTYLLMIWEVWVFCGGCWSRQLQCTKQTKRCFLRQSRVMSKRKIRRWKALLLSYTLSIGFSSNFILKNHYK